MQYLRARYYEADTARFTQRDTYLGELIRPVSLNQYTYVENNPLAYTDPDGHAARDRNNTRQTKENTTNRSKSGAQVTTYRTTSVGKSKGGGAPSPATQKRLQTATKSTASNATYSKYVGSPNYRNPQGTSKNWGKPSVPMVTYGGKSITQQLFDIVRKSCTTNNKLDPGKLIVSALLGPIFAPSYFERGDAMLENPNWYTIGNHFTFGYFDVVNGAINPDDPLSLEHWLNSFFLVSSIFGLRGTGSNGGGGSLAPRLEPGPGAGSIVSVKNVIPKASELKNSQTVQNHMNEIIKKGPYKGEASRPYIDSNGTNLLLDEIMNSTTPINDSVLKNGLRWDVQGSFRGSSGTWELVVNLDTKTIVHFNFTN